MRLWTAQAISAFGSRITRTALPIIAVATLGESEAIVALLAAVSLAPGAVLALFAGGFVDRGEKRRILVWADIVRAVVIGSLTIAWAFGALSIIHVCIVGATVGAASALFQIADVAYLPALVSRSRARRRQLEVADHRSVRRDLGAGECRRADRDARCAARGRDRCSELPVVGVHARPDHDRRATVESGWRIAVACRRACGRRRRI